VAATVAAAESAAVSAAVAEVGVVTATEELITGAEHCGVAAPAGGAGKAAPGNCTYETRAMAASVASGYRGSADGSLQKSLKDPYARVTARLIATCALVREESRGGHYRTDFPHAGRHALRTFIRGGEDEAIVACRPPFVSSDPS
jgi:hypothetical protein